MKGLAAALAVLAIWTAGLLAFADRVARLTPAEQPAAADGIVALTGGSDMRLRAAAELLEGGKGRRLLVSGVNRRARRSDLLNVTRAAKPVFDCCVDLGFTAADTIGNAREAADWARTMRFHSLILVTADYHTPRAMLELRAASRATSLQSYPVATPELDVRHWSRTTLGAKRMVVEYCKFLVILVRGTLLGAARDPTAAAR